MTDVTYRVLVNLLERTGASIVTHLSEQLGVVLGEIEIGLLEGQVEARDELHG